MKQISNKRVFLEIFTGLILGSLVGKYFFQSSWNIVFMGIAATILMLSSILLIGHLLALRDKRN